jgi:molybdate transport system substrate-binding protein
LLLIDMTEPMPGNHYRQFLSRALLLAALVLSSAGSLAEQTLVAVASNFTAPAREIAAAFNAQTGHEATLSFGSTGKLYTQIAHGAPYDVFLAADSERPQKAEANGLAVTGSRFTYASGRLVLYSSDAELINNDWQVLAEGSFNKLAIANAKIAPYGKAAIETLKHLGVYETVSGKLVQGENIAQTYQFIATGNAQLGFVAISQVIDNTSGSRWIVPPSLYTPVNQDAVLLARAKTNPAAIDFLKFLQVREARAIISKYGYLLNPPVQTGAP